MPPFLSSLPLLPRLVYCKEQGIEYLTLHRLEICFLVFRNQYIDSNYLFLRVGRETAQANKEVLWIKNISY